MIQLAVFRMLDALPGGVSMALRPSAPQALVTPAQVWPALSLDLRTRVIGRLAQLALSCDRRWSSRGRGRKGGR